MTNVKSYVWTAHLQLIWTFCSLHEEHPSYPNPPTQCRCADWKATSRICFRAWSQRGRSAWQGGRICTAGNAKQFWVFEAEQLTVTLSHRTRAAAVMICKQRCKVTLSQSTWILAFILPTSQGRGCGVLGSLPVVPLSTAMCDAGDSRRACSVFVVVRRGTSASQWGGLVSCSVKRCISL